MLYKKASRLGLRIPTHKGNLSVEQLWTLNLKDLEIVIRNINGLLKKENETNDSLSFLGTTTGKTREEEENELRFEILKDIYTTKKAEADEAISEKEKKEYNKKILDIIAKKEDEALENLSAEELKAKLIK